MVRVTCETKDTLQLSELVEFQGDLKSRTEEQIQKIITSIEKYGFSFPFYVWKHGGINSVLDGHGRLLALNKLKKDGEEIPALPIVFIDCKDETDAKNLLLRINSQYGDVDKEALRQFMDGIEVDWDEIELPSGKLDFMSDHDIVIEAALPNTDYIKELIKDEEFKVSTERNKFSITFVFDKQYEEEVLQYIKTNGKDGLVDKLLEFMGVEVQECQTAEVK